MFDINVAGKRVQRQFLKLILENDIEAKKLYNKFIKNLVNNDVEKYLTNSAFQKQFQNVYGTLIFKDLLNLTKNGMNASALLGGEINLKLMGEAIDGKVAQTIVKKATNQILTGSLYRDNIGLEQRLLLNVANDMANLDMILFKKFDDTSADEIADLLMDNKIYFSRQDALRTARTSINQSFHLSTIESSKNNPAVNAVQWNLSSSHPMDDICDEYATDNSDGLGPGIYKPDNVPLSHPNCLCYLTPVVNENYLDKL